MHRATNAEIVGSNPTGDTIRLLLWSLFLHYEKDNMRRPDFITNTDIARWSSELDSDPDMPQEMINEPILREVCYAGMWLVEELQKQRCPDELITRIQFSAGKASFGNDPWNIHENFLNGYKNNELDFQIDPNNMN